MPAEWVYSTSNWTSNIWYRLPQAKVYVYFVRSTFSLSLTYASPRPTPRVDFRLNEQPQGERTVEHSDCNLHMTLFLMIKNILICIVYSKNISCALFLKSRIFTWCIHNSSYFQLYPHYPTFSCCEHLCLKKYQSLIAGLCNRYRKSILKYSWQWNWEKLALS